MLATVVITVFGADRPGLVEAVSALVVARGGNWLESRMLHLGGHFAGMVRIEVEAAGRSALIEALQELHSVGLTPVVLDAGDTTTTTVAASGHPGPGGAPVSIEVIGHDRPGIVREISRVLAAHAVNVEELSTERTSAPMSGEPMFRARADVLLPPGLEVAMLRGELEKIAADLMVDLSVRARG